MHPLAVWTVQRRELALRRQESMFFQENVPNFDVDYCLKDPLQDTHHIIHVCTGPRLFGWPASRHRLLTAGLSKQELLWLGPSTLQEVQAEFDEMFGRQCHLTGSVFFQADAAEVQSWAEGLAQKRMRGNSKPVALSGAGLLKACLTPGQLQRLEAYKKIKLERCALDGTYLVDVDHWPHSPGPASGPNFPTLLRHGCIIDLNKPERVAQNSDRFLSLGFPVAAAATTRYHWPLQDVVFSCPDRAVKSFSGNCQSLPAILAWIVYVWCNTARREEASLTLYDVQSSSNDLEDQDEPDEDACQEPVQS